MGPEQPTLGEQCSGAGPEQVEDANNKKNEKKLI